MRPIRVLMGKVGLDGHDRGAKVVMAALRDAGMEVIFSGLHQSPQALARAAIEEDVDVIGISILSGAHNELVPVVIKELKKQGASNIPLVLGGIIPQQDFKNLYQKGVGAIFTPGSRLDEIVNSIEKLAAAKNKPMKKLSIEKAKPAKKKLTKKASKKKIKKKLSKKRK